MITKENEISSEFFCIGGKLYVAVGNLQDVIVVLVYGVSEIPCVVIDANVELPFSVLALNSVCALSIFGLVPTSSINRISNLKKKIRITTYSKLLTNL